MVSSGSSKSRQKLNWRVATFPNALTFLRLALVPAFAVALVYGQFLTALAAFFVAGFSDALDGFIARRFSGQQSDLGRVLDPIADKLLMTTAFVTMSFSSVMPAENHLPIPFWLTASVIGRDILIIVVAAAIALTTPFRNFQPSFWGKVSTFIQISAIGLILIAAAFPSQGSFYLPYVYAVVWILAAVSGFHYIWFVSRLMREQQVETISAGENE